ncbi:MAG: DoxX family membrane protein [Candidatus Eremiobacteraeota bacterium]|nr:DoxX family membrane protein [Candidatus Eremiobacteraeota bacterium]
MRKIARIGLATFFILAGTLHFVKTAGYVRIVPAGFPDPKTLVYISGALEIFGGAGVIISRVRRLAGCGLIALLAAVYPANIAMAVHHAAFADMASPLLLWLRLPLQFALAAWVWYAAVSDAPRSTEAP